MNESDIVYYSNNLFPTNGIFSVNSTYGNLTWNTTSTTVSAFDENAFLTKYLGPRYIDLPLLVTLTIIYSTVFISGTLGNIVTCIVIARNRNMHTATNYYLFSLAVSDLCTLVLGKF